MSIMIVQRQLVEELKVAEANRTTHIKWIEIGCFLVKLRVRDIRNRINIIRSRLIAVVGGYRNHVTVKFTLSRGNSI